MRENPTRASHPIVQGQGLCICYEAVPGQGEDRALWQTMAEGGYLCLADGCGGLGARRYASQANATGAQLAARLATEAATAWASSAASRMPQLPVEGRAMGASLAQALLHTLQQFHQQHGEKGAVRIVGSMQRILPTTLCMALLLRDHAALDCLFLWAGDSRGYVLDTQGLHQLTADHVAGRLDAMENLYRDASLSNIASGEAAFTISVRRVRIATPAIVLLATDGAFAYLPTPMEFEWLLVNTLYSVKTMEAWQRKLEKEIAKMAGDDGTILLTVYGYESFEEMQQAMIPRRMALQKQHITPVRRRKCQREYASVRWQEYRAQYDWTEGTGHGGPDWRV